MTRTNGILLAVLGQSHHLRRPLSKLLGVNDKSLVLGDFVIQRTARRIRHLSLPIQATTADSARSSINPMNKLSSNASTAQLFRREQVLEIADVIEPSGTAMKRIVRDAY
jgi:hypothetical protein